MTTDHTLTATAGTGALLTAGSVAFGGLDAVLGVSVGAVLAVLNVVLFRYVVGRLLAGQGSGALATLKLVGTLGTFALVVRGFHLSVGAVCVGYGALPVGLLLASALMLPQLRSTEN